MCFIMPKAPDFSPYNEVGKRTNFSVIWVEGRIQTEDSGWD